METTANLAAKMIYFLGLYCFLLQTYFLINSQYPDVYAKLQKEIDDNFSDPKEITHDKLK